MLRGEVVDSKYRQNIDNGMHIYGLGKTSGKHCVNLNIALAYC